MPGLIIDINACKSVPFLHESNDCVSRFNVSHIFIIKVVSKAMNDFYSFFGFVSPIILLFSVAFSFVMDDIEVPLKQVHQPTHDTPGKPRNKRRPSVSPPSDLKPVRKSITTSFSARTATKSLAQRVRF